jgi:hypothetical protein
VPPSCRGRAAETRQQRPASFHDPTSIAPDAAVRLIGGHLLSATIGRTREVADPVWRESWRVLRPGGVLLVGFMNFDLFIFDIEALDKRNEFVVRHRIPFSSIELSVEERRREYGDARSSTATR